MIRAFVTPCDEEYGGDWRHFGPTHASRMLYQACGELYLIRPLIHPS